MDNTLSSVTGWTPIYQQRNVTKRNVIRQFSLTSNPLLPYMCPMLMSLIDWWHSVLFEGWGKIGGTFDWSFNSYVDESDGRFSWFFSVRSGKCRCYCFSWATINPIDVLISRDAQTLGAIPLWRKLLTVGLLISGALNFEMAAKYFGRPIHHYAKLPE
jgi:hypothetical protein